MKQRMNAEILEIKKRKVVKLSIPTVEGYTFVDHNDIIYLSALGNSTEIHFDGGKKMVSSKNLGQFEIELIEQPFIRIHDSTIVNLNKVKTYIRADNGWVKLDNGNELKVSDGRKDDLLVFFRSTKK